MCHIFTLRSSILALRLAHLFCRMLKFCWVWVVPGPDSSPPRVSNIDSPWSSRRWYWSALWASWAWSSCRHRDLRSNSLSQNGFLPIRTTDIMWNCMVSTQDTFTKKMNNKPLGYLFHKMSRTNVRCVVWYILYMMRSISLIKKYFVKKVISINWDYWPCEENVAL